MTESEHELEELVVEEAIVSATGLKPNVLQIGIKGDPSLRETAIGRARHTSILDEIYPRLAPCLESIMLERSPYHIFIGFNNGEIRTRSLFDPLREEIHAAERLLEKAYCNRHFPAIPYDEKIQMMRETYDFILANKHFNKVPEFWKNIFRRRHESWEPMTEDEIRRIFQTLGVLRSLEDYYLRNATISIVQSIVRLQFNCDGTQIVRAEDFQAFIENNLP